MLRLTGMDLKLEQYKKGERFVRAIADRRGPAALRAPVGRARRRCRATARSRRPSAGSRASSATPERPRRRRPRSVTEDCAGRRPGRGPGGAPTAIALSPILSARYRVARPRADPRRGARAPGS